MDYSEINLKIFFCPWYSHKLIFGVKVNFISLLLWGCVCIHMHVFVQAHSYDNMINF